MRKGEFFGVQDKMLELENFTFTYTTYTHEKVDWHRHENAYFTFLMMGKMAEINNKERLDCIPGSLLFHNSDEAHYNLKPRDYTRGFHVEIQQSWLEKSEAMVRPGSYSIYDPRRKLMAFELFREFLVPDVSQKAALEFLVAGLLQDGKLVKPIAWCNAPKWVRTIRELINDLPCNGWTLDELSRSAGIHPNHLSRAFSVYFGCTLGQYLRAARIQHAMTLMLGANRSLADIAYSCGFSDQSHFTRTFRAVHGRTPLAYRKELRPAGG